MPTRRDVLRLGLHSAAAWAVAGALPGLAFGNGATRADARLVVVLLRGALDGLSAVPPYGDPSYAAARGPIAIPAPGTTGGALQLDGFFGLHPALAGLHDRYRAGELLVVHAAATPYRDRSHFDGQNVLENGGTQPSGSASGWLNRALAALPQGAGPPSIGLALGQNVPLILRGPVPVASWAPSRLPEVEPELIARLRDLYSNDAILSARIDEAVAIDDVADRGGSAGMRPERLAAKAGTNQQYLEELATTAGKMLAAQNGPRVAVLEMTGWDTHAAEGGAEGPLALRLRGLDRALDALRAGIGPGWARTIVLTCTEFGRTVQVNGTRGTDHGTATTALLLGGAVRGGRVLADWPGLAERDRFEGRDLRATTDLRAIAKGVLRDHLGLGGRALEDAFPASGDVTATDDLVRA